MSKRIMARGGPILTCALLTMAMPDHARAASIQSFDFEIVAALTDDDGDEATDISGVSCLPPDGGKHVCLVIDDQGRLAQAATIEGLKLRGGGKIRLISKGGAPADIVGQEPIVDECSEKAAKFKDLDGEAVAHYRQDFYVVGSHGCSRNGNKFRASSFVLARVPDQIVSKVAAADSKSVDENGPIATSYRLSEALLVAPHVKEFFARDLMTKNGLNIEGLAIIDGKLYAGLRAPVVDTKAYLIEVDLDALFDAGKSIALGKEVREIELDFLGGRGIRDLAALGDGRLVVLSGPAQADGTPFALHFLDPKTNIAKPIAVLGDVPSGAKAEGLHVLAQSPKGMDLVIMFDGPKSGGARRYSIEFE
jgi:hypothetical protein